MLRFPNCKINLGLYITRKREDGYHDIETIFYPVPLHDVLEVVPAQGDESSMHLSGLQVAGNATDNLVWKAYELMRSQYPAPIPAIDIFLHKSLPMGAGLGGGSADGAFMLALLNDYCKLGCTEAELASMALQLGSDCPFFIYNTPQFATGRGEQMQPVSIDLSGFSLQLICPEVHIATGKAFSMITPRPAPYDLRQLQDLPVVNWKEHVSNDFEDAVFAQHPELAEIKEQLYSQGAIYAAMSGSGSTIYGLFQKGIKASLNVNTPFKSFYIQ